MRWFSGVCYVLSILAFIIGVGRLFMATFVPNLNSASRLPTEGEILAGIGWIGAAIFLQLLMMSIEDRPKRIESRLVAIQQTLNKIGRALKQ